MICAESRDLLQEALDGRIQPGARAALDEHLAACNECRSFEADLAEMRRLFEETPPVTAPPASTRSAPVPAMSSVLLPTILFEMSGYLTQNVPPNPQQTLASFCSRRCSPSTEPSRWRGWSLTDSSRSPEQES